MANHKSAKKRIIRNANRAEINKSRISRIRSFIKKVENAITSGNKAAAQTALKEATDVPLACAKLCRQVIDLSEPAAQRGNTNVISDAGVALLAGYAGLRSAALNVYINIGGIKDKEFADDRRQQLESLLDGLEGFKEEVYDLVKSKL